MAVKTKMTFGQKVAFALATYGELEMRARSKNWERDDAIAIVEYLAKKGKMNNLRNIAIWGEDNEIACLAVEKLAEAKDSSLTTILRMTGGNEAAKKLAAVKAKELGFQL